MHPSAFILILHLCLNYQDVLAVSISGDNEKNAIQMDMAKNSAAYIFTRSLDADNIAIAYISEEKKYSKEFKEAWEYAEKNMKCKVPSGLSRQHMLAVYAYTVDYPVNSPFYSVFSEAVRMFGATDEIYAQSFKFKSFHYLLSVAIDKLGADSSSTTQTVYRGSKTFLSAKEGAEVRFGSFTSSSFNVSDAIEFTDLNTKTNTLFYITTRYGVPIYEYSCFEDEKEILIPAYEVFRVGKTTSWERGTQIPLKGERKQGTMVKVEKDKDGKLVVVRSGGAVSSALEKGKDGKLVFEWNGGAIISASGGVWILAALVSISV